MSIEGSDFQCSITGERFAATDLDARNKHCAEHGDYHTQSGTTVCAEEGCGKELRYKKYPYIPLKRDATGVHLVRSAVLFCNEHGGENMNPRNVQVEEMAAQAVQHKDSQTTEVTKET